MYVGCGVVQKGCNLGTVEHCTKLSVMALRDLRIHGRGCERCHVGREKGAAASLPCVVSLAHLPSPTPIPPSDACFQMEQLHSTAAFS